MARLWGDIPDSERRWPGHWEWRGCPYAVQEYQGGYRRCASPVPDGSAACGAHDPTRQKPARYQLAGLVKQMVLRAERRRREDGDRTPALQWFRALGDDDIREFHYSGVKTRALIREIRDEWDDERVVSFFEFPKPRAVIAPDPTVFWAQRHDIFNVVGG